MIEFFVFIDNKCLNSNKIKERLVYNNGLDSLEEKFEDFDINLSKIFLEGNLGCKHNFSSNNFPLGKSFLKP